MCEAILVNQQYILTLFLIPTGIPAASKTFTMSTSPPNAALCNGESSRYDVYTSEAIKHNKLTTTHNTPNIQHIN